MASGEKSGGVMTQNSIGGTIGQSDGMIRKKIPGGVLVSAYPQDNVHGVHIPNATGDSEKFGGSDTNLAHSLKGSAAVQNQPGESRSGSSGKKEI